MASQISSHGDNEGNRSVHQNSNGGDCFRLWMGDHRAWHGDRSLSYPDQCSTRLFSIQGGREIKELLSQRSVQAISGCEEQIMGWRILGQWVLRDNRRQSVEQ